MKKPESPHSATPDSEQAQATCSSGPQEQAALVADYLRANPAFLSDRPELYEILIPPRRVHGEAMADHMAAMIAAARTQARDLEAKAATLLDGRRAATGITERVHEAVLALIRAPDPAECVANALPALLGIDAASLCCEGFSPRWRSLPPGAVRHLMRGRRVLFRDRPSDAMMLHAEAELLAERDVLVRLPTTRPAILAMVSRDAANLPAMQGTHAFRFLASVLAALTEP